MDQKDQRELQEQFSGEIKQLGRYGEAREVLEKARKLYSY